MSAKRGLLPGQTKHVNVCEVSAYFDGPRRFLRGMLMTEATERPVLRIQLGTMR